MDIHGFCDPQFSAVRAAFERNFTESSEVGAAVCLVHQGRTVVDLWGGVADPETGRPWTGDTLTVVFSCSKGVVALCAHLLFDRGLLDFDAPVTTYWPEFGQQGKERTTVGMLLQHQAGLPAFHRPLKQGAFYDWDYMVDALAGEAPFWQPGIQVCYHSFNIGWLVGEVIRRIDGRAFGEFFRQEIAEPLGLDFWFGLPESEEPRVAPQCPINDHPFLYALQQHPDSIPALQLRHSGGFVPNHEYNLSAAHRACLPAQGGITNARGLANLYAPLASGGTVHGLRLVAPSTVDLMGTVSSMTDCDPVLQKPSQYSFGFMKSGSWIMSDSAFGHPGSGGSLGFADPEHELAFGYVMNQQRHDPVRRQRLVDAAYQSLSQFSDACRTTALVR